MQRRVVTLVDDLNGREAAETVAFGLDGTNYEIDLTEANARKLRAALGAYVTVARKKPRVGRPPKA